MRPEFMRRRLLQVSAAAAGIGLISGCAIPGPRSAGGVLLPDRPPPAPPAPRARERWRYREINVYNGLATGEVLSELVETSPFLRVTNQHSRRAMADETYGKAWNIVQEPAFDLPITFDTPLPMLTQELRTGASERIATTYRNEYSERRYYWSLYVDAMNWERLRVPAGEFDCLRIVRRIWFTHFDIFRNNSERVDTIWYAPAINRWAQREWTGSFVLAGGRRGARAREEWVRWELLEHIPAPVARG